MLRASLGRYPWPREVWGRVVRFAALGGARAIVFDFTFPEPDLDHPADDSAFAEASRAAGNVVQTIFFQPVEGTADSAIVVEPIPLLRSAARAIGDINYNPDQVDGTARRVPLFFSHGGHAWPTLGLAAVTTADSARFAPARQDADAVWLGSMRVPTEHGALLLNWRGPYRAPGTAHPETYRVYPIAQILHAFDQLARGETPEVPTASLRGKIVFIASSGAGLFDARATPFGPNEPGVIIHATVADNLMTGDFLHHAGTTTNVVAIFAAALIAGTLVAFVTSASLSTALGLALLALQLAVAALLFTRGHIWLDAAAPAIAVVLTFTGGMSLNYVTEGRRKRQIARCSGNTSPRSTWPSWPRTPRA